MFLQSTEPLIEPREDLSECKARPAPKAENFISVCELSFYTM
jgi:hypothetical protein